MLCQSKMPIVINTTNAPNLLVVNETATGFYLATIAVSGVRLYRITMNTVDPLGNPVELYYYFSLDTSSSPQGTPVVLNVPYIYASFVGDSSDTFASIPDISQFQDISTVQSVNGEPMSGASFKLYNLIFTGVPSEQNMVPQLIDLNQAYTIGTTTVMFIYYRKINATLTYYTGIFGDRVFQNEYTNLIPLPSNPSNSLITTDTIGGTLYYFVNTTATPNIVVANGLPTPASQLTDSYSDNTYSYTLVSSSPNVLLGGTVLFGLTIQNIQSGVYLKASDIMGRLVSSTPNFTIVRVYDDTTIANTIDVEAMVSSVSNLTSIDVQLLLT